MRPKDKKKKDAQTNDTYNIKNIIDLPFFSPQFPINIFSRYHYVDPVFLLMHSYSMAKSFFIWKIFIFKKWFGVATHFCFIFKGKQNKKENFKYDFLFGKVVFEKPNLGSGVRLLIGKVR